ncbi:MAG: 50S ribosomal protein L6 [Candidatus Omnitrophica bacterium]|nr:50S ribosomal protein L6 [Candidatus Omnitrophota bacterium]
MSRIGKKPVEITQGVGIKIERDVIKVKGQKGELEFSFSSRLQVEQKDNQIFVKRNKDSKIDRSLHGLTRSLIANMVKGVTDGYEKKLEIRGIGYRAQLKGKELSLNLGFSHPLNFAIPQGITVETPSPTQIVIKGINKRDVGEIAAQIRRLRPPESYKGKGIRYFGEYVRQKQGKKVA